MFFLLISYLGLFFASIVTMRKVETILSIFFDNNTAITNEIVLDEYKSVARKCMYLTLVYIGIIVGVFCICIMLIRYIGLFSSIISFLLFTFVVKELEKEAVKLEQKARTLDCSNSDLEQQYKQINYTWVKKALPDF